MHKGGIILNLTIRDVAKAANVSPSTVSRVLNNNPRISDRTKKKVLKVIKELNYHPNNLARNFANQRSKMIGLIEDLNEVEAFNNIYFYKVIFGLEKTICEYGYNLMFINYNNRENKDIFKKLIMEKRVDGIIFPSFLFNKNILSFFKKKNFPFVLLGEPFDSMNKVNWVDVDNKLAGELVTQHLIDKAYHKIAFIGPSFKVNFSYKRFIGYKETLRKNDFEMNSNYVLTDINTEKSAYIAMNNLLEKHNELDAVICVNNLIAYGALKAIKEKGLNIPENFGIVTFDKFPLANYLEPKLTTVDLDLVALGVEAGKTLVQSIENNISKKQHTIISTFLVEEESTLRKI